LSGSFSIAPAGSKTMCRADAKLRRDGAEQIGEQLARPGDVERIGELLPVLDHRDAVAQRGHRLLERAGVSAVR
jgi:hypothetical protein